MEDLEEVIRCYHETLTFRPPGHPDLSDSLNNLASAFLSCYQQSGRMEDFKEMIRCNREALTLCPPGHAHHSDCLNNLANAVLTRYRQLGRMEDLEDGITYHCEALILYPPGHPNCSLSLNNLATAILTRYGQLGKMEDLEETIRCHHKALILCPPGHPDRSDSINNLANAVLACYEQSGRMEDLEEVIRCHHKALTLRPPGHPNHSDSLNNLAIAIHTRYQESGRMDDLEETITYHCKALILHPPGHPNRSRSLNNLANAFLTCYKQCGQAEYLDECFALYEQAVNDLAASSRYKLAVAIHWAGVAQCYHHGSIFYAYSMSFHLLDRCLISYPNVESQQRFLATAHIPKSLASVAASAAINANELKVAVELLEQGRAILWSKMKGYRYPLDQLCQVNRQLADDFETLSVQLEHLVLSSESQPLDHERPISLSHLELQMQRNCILSEEWEKLIGQIRKIEGFGNFLQAVPFLNLQMAAVEGPVILINISDHCSDAIIIHINKPPILVALPKATPKHLIDLDEQLACALAVTRSSKLILPILHDLWKHIISPVCDCLTQLAVLLKSRIWWCPTSRLCALPLHAAGLYQPKTRNLSDIYTSSYIPTVSALISARSNMIGQPTIPNLLCIGQPSESLSNVQDEIDNIQQLGGFVNVMVGADASCDRVLHSLQQHSWTHFACHGHMGDNSQPFHVSFELHGDSHLTLLDVIQARLPNAELAFLAACHTAAGDPNTPDETIHLAAALQFCGFRSVVGTLWATADKAGPIISKAFYKHMFRKLGNMADFRDSAKALNLAIQELRKEGAPLADWIAFVHIGA